MSICLISVFLSLNLYGQSERSSLIKIGGFIYFLDSKFNGGSFHLEYERLFRKINFLTYGPRVDYINPKTSYGSTTVGYEFKLYPLFKLFKRKPFEGVFIGIDPVFRIKNPDRSYSKYGPGLGVLLGYQKILKNRACVSFEVSTITMRMQIKPIRMIYIYVRLRMYKGWY